MAFSFWKRVGTQLNREWTFLPPDESTQSRASIEDGGKFVLATMLVNVTLAANLILLANDVSLNPRLASASYYKVKGLRIYHLNIHSLRNKIDELRLFCN